MARGRFLRRISRFSAPVQSRLGPGSAQPGVTVGTGLLPLHDALNPSITEPRSGADPLYEAFTHETAAPHWMQMAFRVAG